MGAEQEECSHLTIQSTSRLCMVQDAPKLRRLLWRKITRITSGAIEYDNQGEHVRIIHLENTKTFQLSDTKGC